MIPPVEDAITFTEMMEDLAHYPLVVFPYENENGETLKDALLAARSEGILPAEGEPQEPVEIALVIGPEGGISSNEMDHLLSARCTAITLGKRILRTETAGLAAISAFFSLYGEMEL